MSNKSKCCNSISKPYSTKNGGYMSCDCGKNEFGDMEEKCWCGELMSSDVHPIHEEVNEKVKLRSQESEGWEKEFGEKFSYASFCWNENNVTGVACAKNTKRKLKLFIRKVLSQATEESVEKERARIVEIIKTHSPIISGKDRDAREIGAKELRAILIQSINKLDIINKVHHKE